MTNNIHSTEGFLKELSEINKKYRTKLDEVSDKCLTLTISQYRALDNEVFEQWKIEVFDTVHASCAIPD